MEPVSYGSLKDLEKGRAKSNPSAPLPPSYGSYTPQSSRVGPVTNDYGLSSSTRRLPPDQPRSYVGPPPTRYDGSGASLTHGSSGSASRPSTTSRLGPNAAEDPSVAASMLDKQQPPPTGWSAYTSKAAEYVPTSVGSGWNSAVDKLSDGWSGIANQQRKEQVVGGITKGVGTVVGGAFKLAGKGIWEVGKFATK